MHFNEGKSYCISVLTFLLTFSGKIPKHHFLTIGTRGGEGGLCKSIVAQRGDQHCMVILGGSEFLTFLWTS